MPVFPCSKSAPATPNAVDTDMPLVKDEEDEDESMIKDEEE
jgi:hypothetical protein